MPIETRTRRAPELAEPTRPSFGPDPRREGILGRTERDKTRPRLFGKESTDTPVIKTTLFDKAALDKPVKVETLERTQEREVFKKEKGCVVRALGSALGSEAVEAEWKARFNQMGDTGPYKEFREKHKNLTPRQEEFLRGQEIAYADAQVATLIKDFRQHDTAVGEALRNKEVEEYGRQDEAGIRELLKAGREVTVIGRVEGGSRHMVHVTTDRAGRLVAQSDGGKSTIDLKGEYTTIAFANKGKAPVQLSRKEKPSVSALPHLNENIKYHQAA